MKKIILKIILVLTLSSILAWSIIHYTSRGARLYQHSRQEIKHTLLQRLDARPNYHEDPYINSPYGELSGAMQTGTISNSGQVDNNILQERLEYYRSHKTELGM